MAFSPNLDPANLNGDNGLVINGIGSSDRSGQAVSDAGDINGDGIDDLIIGAPGANASYVVFGSNSGLGADLALSTLNGSNGFVISSEDNEELGKAVSSAGDVNGDGIDDLIVGAPSASISGTFSYEGRSYVVFGSRTGFNSTLSVSTLNGSNGFAINGVDTFDYTGTSVSHAGDINGDGLDDLIVGANGANGNYAGGAYVIFGSSSGFDPSLDLASLDGSNGFALQGIDDYDQAGRAVSSAGDINGDGIDDLLVSAPNADISGAYGNEGESYVVFGSSNGFGANLSLASLNGANGFVLTGINASDRAGQSVSGAGDINGDGFDDLIIGASNADIAGASSSEGQSYIVFGSNSSFGASFDLSTLDGSNGFVVNGVGENNFSGESVSSAGDINGDGFDDIIVGAYSYTYDYSTATYSYQGHSYVIFGSSNEFGASFNLSSLDGSNGFVVSDEDIGGFSGEFVSGAGDINGDGVDDIIVGARRANGSGFSAPGASYVIFGLPTVSLTTTTAFAIEGATAASFTVSRGSASRGDLPVTLTLVGTASSNDYSFSTGTLNANQLTVTIPDGQTSLEVFVSATDDNVLEPDEAITVSLLSGDPYIVSPSENASTLTLINEGVMGQPRPINLDRGKEGDRIRGSNKADRLKGTRRNDTLLGRNGNDRLKGDKGRDVLKGGNGKDQLRGGKGVDQLEGNKGNDRLLGQDGNDVLIGGLGADVLIGGKGKDTFVYNNLAEGKDRIQKFEADKGDIIDLSGVFDNPIFTGVTDFQRFFLYVDLVEVNGSTEIKIDADGSGPDTGQITLATVQQQTGLSSVHFALS